MSSKPPAGTSTDTTAGTPSSQAYTFVETVINASTGPCKPCELRLLISPICWVGDNFISTRSWVACSCKDDVVALAIHLFNKVPKESLCENCQTIRGVLARRALAKRA